MSSLVKRPTNRVLLIVPPMIMPHSEGRLCELPLGPAYIAASLERDGFDVTALDATSEGYDNIRQVPDGRYTYGLTLDEIIARIDEINPHVVGISCPSSMQYTYSKNTAARLKTRSNPPLIAIGGSHASALPEPSVNSGLFDLVVIGEADETFSKALRLIADGDLDSLTNIPGLCYRMNEKVIRTPGKGIVDDLDSLPFPARHLFPMDMYTRLGATASHDATCKASPFTQMLTSRGCPAKCSFCSIHTTMGGKFRARSIDSVIAELKELKEKWGMNEVQFEDDNLTLNRKHAEKLFNAMIDEKLDLAWSVPNGVAIWTLNPEMIDLMARSGCYKLTFAIESGVQRVLDDVINKPLKLETVPDLVNCARKNKLHTQSFFVVGFPRETRAEMVETFRYASKIKTDWVSIFIATPYPGTELYEEALEKGLLPEDFSFDALDVRNASIKHPEISPADLAAMVAREEAKIRMRNYLKPVNFKRALKRVLREPWRFTDYFKDLVSRNLARYKKT